MRKLESTIILDFMIYIYCPMYLLFCSTQLKKVIFNHNILFMIVYVLILILGIFTIYMSFKKDNIAYYLLNIFIPIGIVNIVIDILLKYSISDIIYIIGFVIFTLILLILNYLYLLKNRSAFRKHTKAHIKKCPGCNRIIPINMVSCGKCKEK